MSDLYYGRQISSKNYVTKVLAQLNMDTDPFRSPLRSLILLQYRHGCSSTEATAKISTKGGV